jgi:charged multivesicular body protein 4
MMSFLKNLFGGSAPRQTTVSANEALERLSEQADMLKKRIEHLEAQIQEQEDIAKKYATTNKTRAMAALKKKKQLQEHRVKAEGTLDNIENQKDMLENTSSNAAILKTMADTAKIVKQQHDNLDINKIEDIVEDIREQKEISEEIANILSQNTVKQHDDDELLKELEGLQQEEIDKKLLDTNKEPLPDVPTQLPAQPALQPSSSKKDEDELDELKKWASAAQ